MILKNSQYMAKIWTGVQYKVFFFTHSEVVLELAVEVIESTIDTFDDDHSDECQDYKHCRHPQQCHIQLAHQRHESYTLSTVQHSTISHLAINIYMPIHTVQYSTVQYSTVQRHTQLSSRTCLYAQHSTVQYNIVQYNVTLSYHHIHAYTHSTAHSTVQYNIAQYTVTPSYHHVLYTQQYSTVQHHT